MKLFDEWADQFLLLTFFGNFNLKKNCIARGIFPSLSFRRKKSEQIECIFCDVWGIGFIVKNFHLFFFTFTLVPALRFLLLGVSLWNVWILKVHTFQIEVQYDLKKGGSYCLFSSLCCSNYLRYFSKNQACNLYTK